MTKSIGLNAQIAEKISRIEKNWQWEKDMRCKSFFFEKNYPIHWSNAQTEHKKSSEAENSYKKHVDKRRGHFFRTWQKMWFFGQIYLISRLVCERRLTNLWKIGNEPPSRIKVSASQRMLLRSKSALRVIKA